MKAILSEKSEQVLENLTGIALGNGFKLPEGMNRKTWARKKFELGLEQNDYVTNFLQALLEVEKIRDYFVGQLKNTLLPTKYGISREWRQTQREALEAIIHSLGQWYARPLSEIPTGTGKSMIWGAVARAYYDTLRMFGVEDMFEIVILTSRINIADQMIGSTVKNSEDDTEDEPLIYGDVKMWLPMLSDDDIRILAGRPNDSKEFKKKAKITISCYQGLNAKTVDFVYTKKAGLVIMDESHRATNRIRIILENKMHTAFFVGGSATAKGPVENNPFKFFEAMKPELENGKYVPFNERLAYHASIPICIERREYKPVRYINVRTYIDLSSLESKKRRLPEREAGALIAKNIPLLKQLLDELFLGDYPVLSVVGSKSVIDRKWLVFVDRIKIAKELAEYCNTELKSFLIEKYGESVNFSADYVSGTMGRSEFNDRMNKYKNSETTIMFSSDKLGEGADVPDINGIFSLRAYSIRALWKTIQEMGRGGRHVEGEDLLMVDGIFKSKKHEIASALNVFGIKTYVNGGLVAGYTGERETETKIFTLLKKGLNWKQVWNKLTKEERELAPFIRQYLGFNQVSSEKSADYNKPLSIKSIEFVENESVRIERDFYSTWQEASEAVKKFSIDINRNLEKQYQKLREQDFRLPSNLWQFYKDYPGHHVFFQKKNYYPTWNDAQKACVIFDFKDQIDYRKRCKKVDAKLPPKPNEFYVNFPGWDIYLSNSFLKSAPKGWMTSSSLVSLHKIPQGQILNCVEKYRKIKPEWFCMYLSVYKVKEHYSPELVALIVKSQIKRSPKDWMTPSQLSKELCTTQKNITCFANQYRRENAGWFNFYLRFNLIVEHYSPELVEIIRKSLRLRPEGWMSLSFHKALGISRDTAQKEISEYRRTRPEFFGKHLLGSRIIEYYSPELIVLVRDSLKKLNNNPPEGWKTASYLHGEEGIACSQTIRNFVDQFRKSNPKWFQKYSIRGMLCEYYSPELVALIRQNLDEKAPKGWMTMKELSKKMNLCRSVINQYVLKSEKDNPNWFKRFPTKSKKRARYCSPEFFQKIKEYYAKK